MSEIVTFTARIYDPELVQALREAWAEGERNGQSKIWVNTQIIKAGLNGGAQEASSDLGNILGEIRQVVEAAVRSAGVSVEVEIEEETNVDDLLDGAWS